MKNQIVALALATSSLSAIAQAQVNIICSVQRSEEHTSELQSPC